MSSSASSTEKTVSSSTTIDLPPRPSAYAAPPGWVGEPFDKKFVVGTLRADMKSIIDSKLNMLYGTSVTSVVAAFLKSLFKARAAQNPSQLLIDMVFAVFVSQTVSREWSRVYPMLGRDSMFTQFEITGTRTSDPKVPMSSWVNSSAMNATAIGILGHVIMESTSNRSSLGKKAKETGTIFSPGNLEDHPGSEYVSICIQSNKNITVADRNALEAFQKYAGHLVDVIETLLESSSSSLEEITEGLNKLELKKF